MGPVTSESSFSFSSDDEESLPTCPSSSDIESDDSEEEEDPDPPPKPPPTAYIVYTNKFRAKVMEENPTLSSNDISKKLVKIWRAAPAAEKKALSANYSKEYDVYRQKMKEWQNRNPERGRLLRSQQWRLRNNPSVNHFYR